MNAEVYPTASVERSMKVQEVILKAMSGELRWVSVADILGWSPRRVRRWRARYEKHGYDGLLDRRTRRPSKRRVSVEELERVLRLYREKYTGFNALHFYEKARKEHELKLSYSRVKQALQGAGLVAKGKRRGKHRLRRERRECFGEMLHIDGSLHAWLALCPEERQTMVVIVDDATSRILYAQLVASESTASVMGAMKEVFESYGLPIAFYHDRASWGAYTPKAGEKVDKTVKTQVGRVLDVLGVEQIFAYSPQARGRSERVNRTLQDRLVSELRAAGIATAEAANAYLRETFLPAYNERFGCDPKVTDCAFVALGKTDLDALMTEQHERIVAKDNTVAFESMKLQIHPQPGWRTCAGKKVTVRKHLDETHSIAIGKRILGIYNAKGQAFQNAPGRGGKASLNPLPSVAA